MMLMDERLTAIGFSGVSSSGDFNFPSMDYGTYYMRAELSGVISDNMKVEITPEKPHVDVSLTFSGNSILGLEDAHAAEYLLAVYPNPVSDKLNISLHLLSSTIVDIEIYAITGQLVYKNMESISAGQNTFTIPFNNFPGGLYTLRIYSMDGINIVRKVIK